MLQKVLIRISRHIRALQVPDPLLQPLNAIFPRFNRLQHNQNDRVILLQRNNLVFNGFHEFFEFHVSREELKHVLVAVRDVVQNPESFQLLNQHFYLRDVFWVPVLFIGVFMEQILEKNQIS